MHVVPPQVGPASRTNASEAARADVATDELARARQSPHIPALIRPRSGGTWLSIAFLLVVVSLSMADGLVGDVVAYERDTTVFYFPLMRWVSQQLQSGVFPLWTPQVFGGYPIFADGEIGLAYPPALLALWLFSPERAFVFLRLLHLWIAAVGAFALARVIGLPRTAAVLAGLVFALGNFMQAQIHHENIVRTAAWLPLVLALVELALRSTTVSRRITFTVLAALGLGMAGLGLHSQMLAIDLLVLAGYAALRCWAGPLGAVDAQRDDRTADGPDRDRADEWPAGSKRRRRRPQPIWLARFLAVASVCLPVVVLGLCLAAVQLVPLLELAGFSPRGSGYPYSEAAAYSLTPYGLVQVLFPFVFRGPNGLQWGLWTHWESYVYVGLVPLVLAVVALLRVRRREVALWGILALVGTLIALGQYSPLNLQYLLWLVPGLSSLRAPGRFTIVVVLALGMLAAYGLAWLQQASTFGLSGVHRPARSVARGAVILALSVAAAVVLGHVVVNVFPTATQAAIDAAYLSLSRDSYPLTQADVYAGLQWATDLANPRVQLSLVSLFILAALLATWLLDGPRALKRWSGWPSLLAVFAALDLLAFAWGIHPRNSLGVLAAPSPVVTAIQQAASASTGPGRVLSAPVLNQVAADRLAPFDLQEANGYSSLQFAWHRDYLGRVLEVDDDLLDLWNVRYVVDPATYGALPQYRGVIFLPGQMLLHAPAGSADSEQSFAITPGSDVAEVRLVSAMMGAIDLAQGTPVAEVELRGPTGEILAARQLLAGQDVMEWSWDQPGARPYVRHQRAEVAGRAFEGNSPSNGRLLSFAEVALDPPVPATSLVIRAVLPAGELAVLGGGVVGRDGSIQQLFGRTKSKYRPIYADKEMRVSENTAAMPRAFLVGQARTAPTIGAALGEMIHRPFDPRREVIVSADTAPEIAARLPSTSASMTGSAQVVDYAPNRMRLHTSSDGDALLVVSDTYYPGWLAFVDGVEQPLVRGDLLFRVVPVSAGEHEVELRFEPSSVRLGLLISLVALVVAVAALVLSRRGGRRADGLRGGAP